MLEIITPPACDPIHVLEARAHVKQDYSDDDAQLAVAVKAATAAVQTATRRQIVAARYRLTLDAFPGIGALGAPLAASYGLPDNALVIPWAPVVQVVSIQYLDMAGVLQTMPTTDYVVSEGTPTRISPIFGRIWPIALPQIGSVRVNVDVGHVAKLTANATTNAVTVTGWKALAVGDAVRLSNSGGALPAPLAEDTDYYVQSVVAAGSQYTLAATSGGTAIDITDAGTGTHFLGTRPEGMISWAKLRIGALDMFRAEVPTDSHRSIATTPLPFVDGLLDPYRLELA